MKRQIIIITLLIFVLSCKKEGIDYVRGTVIDNVTNEPISSAEVILYANPYIGDMRILERVLTDQNGYYRINYNKIVTSNYIVKCFADNYSNRLNFLGTKLKHGKTAANFLLIPQGYLKLRFVKTDVSNNLVAVKAGDFGWFLPNVAGNPQYPFTAESILIFDANKNIAIQWHLVDMFTLAPDTNEYFDNVFIPRGDTLLYTITFN